jgi:hypothetical protein
MRGSVDVGRKRQGTLPEKKEPETKDLCTGIQRSQLQSLSYICMYIYTNLVWMAVFISSLLAETQFEFDL